MPPTFWRAFAGPLCIAVAIIGLLALVLREQTEADRSNADAQARARAHAVLLAAQAASLDSARTALSHASEHVARDVVRYHEIRDTLNLLDTVQVKVFVERADSVVRACTDLVESCAVFRVRAESSLAGLTVDRDLWKGIAESQKPSKWAAVKEWGLRLSIGYVAFKVGQGVR